MLRRLSFALPLVFVSACVAPSAPPPAPAPTPRPTPAPAPAPLPPPPPASSDWHDWPLTLGDWRYSTAAGGSVARYGAVASLTCDRASRSVAFAVQGTGQRLTVRTSSAARSVAATPSTQPGMVEIRLPARDNLFDAMGFSRGRFVVEGAGARPLVLPAWPEILRVAEDCRG